jgi:hypothetical protein
VREEKKEKRGEREREREERMEEKGLKAGQYDVMGIP